MASGWANDGAVQDQIDSTLEDAVARVRNELPRAKASNFVKNVKRLFRKPAARRFRGCVYV